MSFATTLVLGATGDTGKHVVRQLLQQGKPVRVVVRSKERFHATCAPVNEKLLTVTEASLLEMTEEQWQEQLTGVDNVVSCLGHNMSFSGIFGQPRRLVLEVTKIITKGLAASTGPRKKFILMNSDGVSHPAGSDDRRGLLARWLLFFLRYLLPPHADNEEAAAFLYNCVTTGNMDWIILRPTDLINGNSTDYILYPKPIGGLFGSAVVTRANVAKAMVDFLSSDSAFQEYKFCMPVVHDLEQPASKKEL